MLKKTVLNDLLNEELDKLKLPIADKQVLRDTLANPESYRLRMGHRTFCGGLVVEAADPDHRDLRWLSELSIAGKAFFHFAEACSHPVSCQLNARTSQECPSNKPRQTKPTTSPTY